jgi:acid phosphatase type 7
MARSRAPRKPTVIEPVSAATGHPGLARDGQPFSIDRLPPGFSTIKSPSRSQPFQDLPSPTGLPPFRLGLSTFLSDAAIEQIRSSGRLVFHTVGDTGGVNTPGPIETVALYMEQDFTVDGDQSRNPSFFYHLGDVVYYAGEVSNYYWEFYEPYRHYPGPIVAIPGNHDGDIDPLAPAPSLAAFVANFCAQAPVHRPEAQDTVRKAMIQPNVYWTLDAELATIIGLYSNCPEGGVLSQPQIDWFGSELAAAPGDKPLILSVHHPLYSAYGSHPGSQPLKSVIETACTSAGRFPDLVLSGHVHNYQRFTGPLGTNEVTCIVAGAGGYNRRLHHLAAQFHNATLPIQIAGSEGTLEAFSDTLHGYLRIEITENNIHGDYLAVPDTDPNQQPLPAAQTIDSFDIPFPLHGA